MTIIENIFYKKTIQYLKVLIILLCVNFLNLLNVNAYFSKDSSYTQSIATITYQQLQLLSNKESYGFCDGQATIHLSIGNPNNYNVTYTISFNNNDLTYKIDGVAPSSYTLTANNSKTHDILVTGSTSNSSLTMTVTSNTPYSSSVSKTVSMDLNCPLCTWGTLNDVTATKTNTYDITCKDTGSGMQSSLLTTSDFVSSNTSVATITNVSNPVTVTNGYKYTVTAKGLNVGNFALSLKASSVYDNAGNANILTSSGTINVVRSKTATTGSCNTLTYNKAAQNLASGAVNATYVNNSGTSYGNYEVTINANDNYAFSDGTISKTLTCTINKKTLTVANFTYSPITKAYNGSTAAPSGFAITATTGSGLISGDNVTISYTSAAYNNANVASATSIAINGMSQNNSNYVLDSTSYTKTSATITAATPNLTLANKSAAYTGSAIIINAPSVSGVSGGTTPNGTITYTYYSGTSCGTALSGAPSAIGSYSAKASMSASGNYGAEISNCATLIITDTIKPVCVWTSGPNPSTISYGSSSLTLTCTDNIGINGNSINSSDLTVVKTGDVVPTISNPTMSRVSGGYSYNFTVTAAGSGTIKLKLNAEIISDTAGNGNNESALSNTLTVDNEAPSVGFSVNGNNTYAKSNATVVTLTDNLTGVASAKYLWTQTAGTSAASGTSFSSGNTISKSSGNGDWYLCIYTVDQIGNENDICSNVFRFDNELPVINPNSTSICISKGSTASLSNYVNISDSYSGVNYTTLVIKNGSTVVTNLSSLGVGNYTITYNVSDNAGNAATQKSITFNIYSKILGDQAVVTSGDGLYVDSKTVGRYYFRGANPNNYVTYNGGTWRIISIEPDGTYKLIYNGIYSNAVYHTSGSNLESYTGTSINTLLNTTYYNAMTTDAKNQLITHDFNAGTVPYGASTTGVNISATIDVEKSRIVSRNVALPSVTDYLRASTNCNDSSTWNVFNNSPYACKTNNWMYISSSVYWVLNPYSASRVRYQNTSGSVSLNTSTTARGVRPTIYLKETTTFTGSGTSTNPYVISSTCSASQFSTTTCNITTTSGYTTSKTLTISPSQSTGITYSWDGINYSSSNTKAISAAGTYNAYIKDAEGKTNSCSVKIVSRNEYQHYTCSQCKTCTYCNSGTLCQSSGSGCYIGRRGYGELYVECSDLGYAWNSCNSECYNSYALSVYGTSCNRCGCNSWNTSDTTWYTTSCGTSDKSSCKDATSRTTYAVQ